MNYAILESAIKNAKISVDEIALKAGVSKPTVYNSFKTGKVAIGIIEKICNAIDFDMAKLFEYTLPEENNLVSEPSAEYTVEISYKPGDKILIDDEKKKIIIIKK